MIKKFIIYIIISFFLYSCGFQPIYVNKNKSDLKIEKINFSGDRLINNYLKLYFKRYTNNESNKVLIIDVKSEYDKKTLSKDKTGNVVDYELVIKADFNITLNGKFIKTIRLSDKFIMQKNLDKYEEQNYENSIKQNFANSLYEKVIIQLTGLQE